MNRQNLLRAVLAMAVVGVLGVDLAQAQWGRGGGGWGGGYGRGWGGGPGGWGGGPGFGYGRGYGSGISIQLGRPYGYGGYRGGYGYNGYGYGNGYGYSQYSQQPVYVQQPAYVTPTYVQQAGGMVTPGYPQQATQVSDGDIVIIVPDQEGATIDYLLNGTERTIRSGQTQSFGNDRMWVIEFDRGANYGTARYTLSPGTFKFKVTDRGWELMRSASDSPTRR